MKIIITEDQLDIIKDIGVKKNILFKYWEKYPRLDKDFYDFFGIDKYTMYTKQKELLTLFREFLGGDDVAIEEGIKILKKNPHNIGCGGYDFNISFSNVLKDGSDTLSFEVIVDDENGEVILMNNVGEPINLSMAIHNDDYGWEVEGEVNECIIEYLNEYLTSQTGIEYIIREVQLLSDIPD